MELVRMPISKLRANPLNPRTQFGDLEALADSFELNAANPGEPFNPPIAVADGNVARIVDGERRYRAMKKRGAVKECWVCLCDGMDEANMVVSMLATDDKMGLSAQEMSRGVQQMLILGVDEQTVDRAARKKCAGALKRTVARGGGRPVAMTIEQAIAADELADDAEDYQAVADAGDRWEYVAREIRARRKRDERDDLVRDAAMQAGVQIVEKEPKGYELFKTLYSVTGEQVQMEGPTWAAARQVLVPPSESWRSWELYAPKRAKTEQELAAIETANSAKRAHATDRKRRFEFVGGMLRDGKCGLLREVGKMVAESHSEIYSARVREFRDLAGCEELAIALEPSPWLVAAVYPSLDDLSTKEAADVASGEGVYAWKRREFRRYADLVDALVKDGYGASHAELDLAAKCREKAGGGESHD